jgi:hypothetical protein
MPITSPVRASDFVNSEKAQLEWVEEICATSRIAPSNVEPFQYGFLLRLFPSDRFYRWWLNQHAVNHHLYIDSSVLDRFGTTLQISRQTATTPKEVNAAITTWRNASQTAQHLRTRYLVNAFGGDSVVATETFTSLIIGALQIPERPANSRELPAWHQVKWGTLLRLDPPSIERALDYLLLERPVQGELSPIVPLGAGVMSVVAASHSPEEPIQIGISHQWADDLMSKTLSRWLRGFEPKALSDTSLLPT